MNIDLVAVRADLASFADDDHEVLLERDSALLVRGGETIAAKFVKTSATDLMVEVNNTRVSYGAFLSKHLANLDVFAQRIIAKRPAVPAFVNGPARRESMAETTTEGLALDILEQEVTALAPFSSRVVFITADAGHGKTALLRQYQHQQAERFLTGRSPFVFWHIDLQGRQLLRLSEALMGDLGELRVSGLWMSSILTLLRRRLLVLAVDGFDELAAEQGSTDALGALALLVREMGDEGTIVAASRRTFFDTEDYLRRAGMLRRSVSDQCEFDQIHLLDWRHEEGVRYLSLATEEGQRFEEPERVLNEIVSELSHDPSHPMVSRPFLLAHVARALLRYQISPAAFIHGMSDPMEGVASIVSAFVKREVSEKWKSKDTGEPYLSVEQHMRLLAGVAEEMWLSQKDRLRVDVIEMILMLLLDEWKIQSDRRLQILEMVKMHVLLNIPQGGDAASRAFDHAEFRNYFTAIHLADLIGGVIANKNVESLVRFLSVAQLPDSVASYAAGRIDKNRFPLEEFVASVCSAVARELRPTYLQVNVGTLLPFLLDRYQGHGERIKVEAPVIYSSLVFEKTKLRNVEFLKGTFINTSLLEVDWKGVTLSNCDLSEVRCDRRATYQDVVLRDCTINGVILTEGQTEVAREYSPTRTIALLQTLGMTVLDGHSVSTIPAATTEGQKRVVVRRFLRVFSRTTAFSERIQIMKFHNDLSVLNEVISIMKRYGLVEEREGKGGQILRTLTRSVEEILRGDGDSSHPLCLFWREIDEDE